MDSAHSLRERGAWGAVFACGFSAKAFPTWIRRARTQAEWSNPLLILERSVSARGWSGAL
jgi:hypothetical protein